MENRLYLGLNNLKEFYLKNKIVILSSVILLFLGITILIALIPNVFAQPVKNVEIISDSVSFEEKDPGAWKVDKSAKWIGKGEAEITFDVDTIMKSNNKYSDVLFVLDVSGSMSGNKLNRVKADSIELIESLLSNGQNKAGLITFDSASNIVLDFTKDEKLLKEKVNSLTTTGCTNYYQALVNVDEVLKNYKKEKDRECIVLFLTDGYPNEDTPNEETQYSYLRQQYPFVTINGIQYEMGTNVLDPVKKVSDNQFIADMDTLNNVLFDASVTPITYDEFSITDYIDTNYFYVEDESKIKVSQGNISFDKKNQKITWTINEFKSGFKAKMTIKAKLKDEFINKGGFYPTNIKEEIKSKLEDIEENVESDKTPVLSDNYKVIYDGNAPAGCNVEGIPETRNHSVFDVVGISDTSLKCEGYQFRGWEIVTDSARWINDGYFTMPEEDVVIRAKWGKLNITKSMTGTVKEVLTLYKQVENDANSDNHAKKYTGSTDETFIGDKAIYYYKGETPNNNVLFGGFCWRMVRTTDTGGVKMIYNGEPDNEGKCGNGRENHVGYGSRTSQSLSSSYMYGTDYTYDDASKTFTLAGVTETATWSETTSASLIGKYTCKNTTGSCSTLYYVDSYSSSNYAYVIPLNSTTTSSIIGESSFNSNNSSLASVGYMYNKRYPYYSKKDLTSSISVLYRASLSTNYYYADSVEYDSGKYKLVEPYQVKDATEYPSLVGKYTLINSSENYTSNRVYYITNVSNDTIFYIRLQGRDLASENDSYYFADSLVDDGTGKKILDPLTTKTVKRTEWSTDYTNYKGKYYRGGDGNIYYVTATTPSNFTFVDVSKDYMYGNSFTYDETTKMYTLSGETQHFYDWENNYDKLSNTHYTCWNTSGTCSQLSYIYYIEFSGLDGYFPNYIKLENGVSIDRAIDEMLYDDNVNTNDSDAKSIIDLWYSRNMIEYTDYLEDIVWCNDRSIADFGGWNPNGGNGKRYLYFGSLHNDSLTCPNKNDRFTVGKENGNGVLTYPVGLITKPEASLSDSRGSPLSSGVGGWLLSPYRFYEGAGVYIIGRSGSLVSSSNANSTYYVNGIRPAVSLRAGIEYESGDGTVDHPYIIDMDS